MTNTPNLADAIRSLYPTAEFGYKNNDFSTINWSVAPDPLPTEAEIQAEVTRLQAEYDALAYSRNRSTEYPALAEQLDEIYHNGIASWKATIKVTKDKYPKG